MGDKKKVCIVTWYGSNNYGTNLQAYALYHVLKENNIKADFIKPFKGRRVFHQYPGQPFKLSRFIKTFLNICMIREIQEIIRQKKIMRFLKEELTFINPVNTKSDISLLNEKYDYFLTGSDQIWNPFFLDTFYLLDFVQDDKKKIAYSSSIAVNTIPLNLQPIYIQYLSRFKAICCRENTGSSHLSSLIHKEVKTVLDPVLLLDKDKWTKLGQKASLKNKVSTSENYIFCYFIGDKTFEWDALEDIRKATGIQRVLVFLVSPPKHINKKYEYLRTADIADFIWYLQHASYVVTDSFHNVAMCLKLEKDFVALMRCKEDEKSENSRMYDFLTLFNLTHKIYTTKGKDYLNPISFSEVEQILEKKVNECTKILMNLIKE